MADTGSQGRPAATTTGTRESQERAVLKAAFKAGFAVAELVMSVVNANNENGFLFASLTQFVFGGSAVIEVVGVLYALVQASRAYDEGRFDFGKGGSPLMTVWKAADLDDESLMRTAVMSGFGAQAFALWLCFFVYLVKNGIGGVAAPVVGLTTSTLGIWRVIKYANEQHASAPDRAPANGPSIQPAQSGFHKCFALAHVMLLFAALLAPVLVEIIEGVLLFGSGSGWELVLAVFDIGYVVLALPFIFSFICSKLPEMFYSAINYRA